ncbi:SMR family transporter [Halobacillus seohaensis]|uniref:SMR family transporter n=1 Tax=Halobacillus seohaensis TaxID=447421 RepID=A0ABW2EMT3_9BACI
MSFIYLFSPLSKETRRVDNEIGMINALWSGGGTLLVMLLGVGLFHESVTMSKVLGLSLILAGIMGLTVPRKERSI